MENDRTGNKPVLAWLGTGFFRPGMRAHGWDLAVVPYKRGQEVLSYEEVVSRAGTRPDLFVYGDMSCPPPVVGLESFPCPTVFYCVDSHIHSWYPVWAQVFDLCLVSLKDHISRFLSRLETDKVLWMPPMPMNHDRPNPDISPEWDLLFAGTVSRETTPVRAEFLEQLGRRIPGLVVKKGPFRELFPRARLVLNIAERGDLNFRVFEALACKSCLITPMVAHGFTELFTPGEHLFTYDPEDLDALANLVEELLADQDRCRQVARAGNALIEQGHRVQHRAQAFNNFLESHDLAGLVGNRLAIAKELARIVRPIHLHWAEAHSGSSLAGSYLAATKGVRG